MISGGTTLVITAAARESPFCRTHANFDRETEAVRWAVIAQQIKSDVHGFPSKKVGEKMDPT